MKAQAARGGSGTGSAHRRLHAACAVLILAAGTERTGDSEAGSLGSVLLISRGKLAAGGQAGRSGTATLLGKRADDAPSNAHKAWRLDT